MTHMTMRERIARALFAVRDDEFDTDEWEDLDAVGRERWLCYADAITAEFYIVVKRAPARAADVEIEVSEEFSEEG